MARKSPAFSFYPNDWFGGTMVMPPLQRAAYIDLMSLQWVSVGFSREEALVVCRGIPEADVDAVLDAKFVELKPNRFFNERLEEERKKQGNRVNAARENGKKGGRPKTHSEPKGKAKRKPTGEPTEKLSVSVSDSVSVTGADSVSTQTARATETGDSEADGEPTPSGRALSLSDVVEAFNEAMGQNVRETDPRRRSFKVRARDPWWVDNWREALTKAAGIPFYRGAGSRGWEMTIDFFLKPDSVTKILESPHDESKSVPRGSVVVEAGDPLEGFR